MLVEATHCPLRIGSSFVFLSSFFCNSRCCCNSSDNCNADDGDCCTFCSWDFSSYCWRLKPLPHRPRQATLGGVYHIESYWIDALYTTAKNDDTRIIFHTYIISITISWTQPPKFRASNALSLLPEYFLRFPRVITLFPSIWSGKSGAIASLAKRGK